MKSLGLFTCIACIGFTAFMLHDIQQRRADEAPARESRAVSQQAMWQAVAATLENGSSMECRVQPSDDPQFMRIEFRGALLQQMTPYDARKIARHVRGQLGAASFVRVVDDTGHILATSSSAGTE